MSAAQLARSCFTFAFRPVEVPTDRSGDETDSPRRQKANFPDKDPPLKSKIGPVKPEETSIA